jgi:Fuc2NAc and GlcNAc transferase
VTALIVLVACAATSALLVRAVRDFANRRALLDHPNDRSSHSLPKPRLGGVGVVVPVLAVGAWLLLSGRAPGALVVPLAATGLVALLGLADDIRPIRPGVRFAVQVALATVVVAASWTRLPAAAGALGVLLPAPVLAVLAVLWIVWLTNLYNFMDGIDGIAGAQALIASLALAAVAAGLEAETSTVLLLALAGSSAGFLLFNLPPSSIFLGAVGSTSIGFFFGILPLLPGSTSVPVEPVVLALSLFVLDATTTLVRRAAAGEKWYTPHRTHLYQRPVVLGASHGAVLLAAVGAMVVAAACATMWIGSSAPGKVVLLAAPVALFGLAHVAVARMERKGRKVRLNTPGPQG